MELVGHHVERVVRQRLNSKICGWKSKSRSLGYQFGLVDRAGRTGLVCFHEGYAWVVLARARKCAT